jgi:hypothetical protein
VIRAGLSSLLLLVAVAAPAVAAPAPAGWKWVKDHKGNCQMLVPSAWKGETSSAASEDRQARAAIHLLPGKDWAESKAMAQHVMAPQGILEDSESRFWMVLAPAHTTLDGERAIAAPPSSGAAASPPAAVPAPPKPSEAKPADTRPADTLWYVSVPGPLGPCTAQITFKSAAFEDTARTIATSVAAAPPEP